MAKRVRRTYTYTARSWLFELSFWAVVIIGAALALAGVFSALNAWAGIGGWTLAVCNWIKHICIALAMIVPVVMSYQVARQKTKTWFIVWIVFVVLVVAGVILTGFGF